LSIIVLFILYATNCGEIKVFNTLNKVHVAPTKLPQLLSQNTKKCLERQPHKVAVRLCAALTEKIKLLKVEGSTCPSAP